MDMLDDISRELPTNGMKVADLINAFNSRLGYVSNALAQLDRKTDNLDAKLERKLDEQDKALDDIKAVQARAPTRADIAELQKEQMSRETYEVKHEALRAQVTANATDIAAVRAELRANDTRTAKNVQTADELHKDHGDAIKALGIRVTAIEDGIANGPPTRRSVLALWLTGIGIGVALLCSGLSTLVGIAEMVLRATGH